jgi:hypothetical protein
VSDAFPDEYNTCIDRFVQDALTNAAKRASATHRHSPGLLCISPPSANTVVAVT